MAVSDRVESREDSGHDLDNRLVSEALSLADNRSIKPDNNTKATPLPPGFNSACISSLPSDQNGSSASKPGSQQPQYEACVARMPQPGDPPPQLQACVAEMPKPGDPPPQMQACVAELQRPEHDNSDIRNNKAAPPDLTDRPAQTEFDTIGGAVQGQPGTSRDNAPNPPVGSPEQGSSTAPGSKTEGTTPADLDAGNGTDKGGQYQFCSAEDNHIQLAGQANDAASAVNVATAGRHGNNPFFNPGSGALGLVTDFDVSPITVAGWVSNAWSRVGALNDALSGQRPADFHPINGPNGRPSVVAMPQHWYQSNPTVRLGINGRNENITMSLPGFNGSAVTLVTNGRQVLAIDPRNNQAWQLQQDTLFGMRNGFSWTPLPRR